MKKNYKFSAILIIALCSNSISSAQNQGPILANKLVNPEAKIIQTIKKEHFVWIDGQWKFENNKYTWINGHWTSFWYSDDRSWGYCISWYSCK